jgi:hypothetical protein
MGYDLHFTAVTSKGFPFLKLIQPADVRRHGHWSVYGKRRPSVTCNATSSSSGALSIGFHPSSRRDCITSSLHGAGPSRGCQGS